MKFYSSLLFGVIFAMTALPAVSNVATTAGSNLTAYNGTGATNNNKWNNLMNGRAGMSQTTAEANFGNCNAIVLRCASPKCASGVCTDMIVAAAIVAGCVNSNQNCKQYGDDLIQYITAQVVAQSTAKVQQQQNAVEIAKAQADAQASAAAQSNAQMQQMQQQMAQMQQQMAESMNAMQEQMAAAAESQNAQIQSALEAQTTSANAYANTGAAPIETGAVISGLEGLGVAEQLAAKNGISAEILVREQIGGQIETAIEDATLKMKELKQQLDAIIEYAGCDPSVTKCTGPKRVKKFKDMANEFFDPYEGVLESMYDALITAVTVGIDVSDVVMLLSDSCNLWGKFLCDPCSLPQAKKDGQATDPSTNEICFCNNYNDTTHEYTNCYYRVKTSSSNDGRVTSKQSHCRMVGQVGNKEDVWHEWIDPNSGIGGATQVACASDIIGDISIFSTVIKRKNTTIDIETLRDLINQDSCTCGVNKDGSFDVLEDCCARRCNVDPHNDKDRMSQLQTAVDTKKWPTKNACFADEKSFRKLDNGGSSNSEIATTTNITVTGLNTNINSCDAYLTETACTFVSDNCIWLSASKKCISKTIDTNLTFNQNLVNNENNILKGTNTTIEAKNGIIQAQSGFSGVVNGACSSYNLFECPENVCKKNYITGKCVNK